MSVKLSKGGDVVADDGTVIGRVERHEQGPGLYATMMGVSATGSGRIQWIPFSADGTQLTEYPMDRRRDALRLVEKSAQPLTVSRMQLETPLGFGLGDPVQCITASVTWEGFYAAVSRFPAETFWVVDSFALPTSIMPVFSNGTGTRVTSARVLQGEQADAATAEAIRLGLLPEGTR